MAWVVGTLYKDSILEKGISAILVRLSANVLTSGLLE